MGTWMKRAMALLMMVPMSLGVVAEQPDLPKNSAQKTVYNLVVPVRFQGEEEMIGSNVLTTKDRTIPVTTMLDNTYNQSRFSLREYYRSASAGTLNYETVYLFDDAQKHTTLVLPHGQDYYFKQNSNDIGFDEKFINDWTALVTKAFQDGKRPVTMKNEQIDLQDLDSDNDTDIDSLTILYKANPKESYIRGHQYMTKQVQVTTDSGAVLTSNLYNQYGLPFDDVFYREIEHPEMAIYAPGTPIHEGGHMLGFEDLYPYYRTDKPVGKMSVMSDTKRPVPQFPTGREREVQKWLRPENIASITTQGQFRLKAVRDTAQSDVILYKLDLGNGEWLYFEYRNMGNRAINRFDATASGLRYRNDDGSDVGALNGHKSGLLVYVVRKNDGFPSNAQLSKNWQLEVLGGTSKSRYDAPRDEKDAELTYGDISVKVLQTSEDALTFSVASPSLSPAPTPEIPDEETSDEEMADDQIPHWMSKTNLSQGTVIIERKPSEKTDSVIVAGYSNENVLTDVKVVSEFDVETSVQANPDLKYIVFALGENYSWEQTVKLEQSRNDNKQ